MLYAIIGEDGEKALQDRLAARPDHLARIESLQVAGRLILAGPLFKEDTATASSPTPSGSLIVADFASLQEAEAWTRADPYVTAGVFRRVTVKPFMQVSP